MYRILFFPPTPSSIFPSPFWSRGPGSGSGGSIIIPAVSNFASAFSPSDRVLVRTRGRTRAQVRHITGTARSHISASLLTLPHASQDC
ncbi:hypothetical protein E2C01_066000 [Portunus trituberculatus]|uniref:Uncharacterized protein n=1 Tax=Portunus trituberculatus TaxID=210409 RepID=A0A5B7HTD0_PORTR|nr:hypothetical protein [Portunus trituberculatus]